MEDFLPLLLVSCLDRSLLAARATSSAQRRDLERLPASQKSDKSRSARNADDHHHYTVVKPYSVQWLPGVCVWLHTSTRVVEQRTANFGHHHSDCRQDTVKENHFKKEKTRRCNTYPLSTPTVSGSTLQAGICQWVEHVAQVPLQGVSRTHLFFV